VEGRTGTFDVWIVIGNVSVMKRLLHCLNTEAIIDKVQRSGRF
jgi:hypothetical protein